jgi:hypothetical protein
MNLSIFGAETGRFINCGLTAGPSANLATVTPDAPLSAFAVKLGSGSVMRPLKLHKVLGVGDDVDFC